MILYIYSCLIVLAVKGLHTFHENLNSSHTGLRCRFFFLTPGKLPFQVDTSSLSLYTHLLYTYKSTFLFLSLLNQGQ